MTFIPPKTAEKLNGTHPEGTRHKAAMDIAVSLIGNGMSKNAVFTELRDKFPADMSDRELENVVNWVDKKQPSPSEGREPFVPQGRFRSPATQPKPKSPIDHCRWWLDGAEQEADALREFSRLQIPEWNIAALRLFMETLYSPTECLNIVTLFTQDPKNDQKTQPSGEGKTLERDQWLDWFERKGIPTSKAGGWLRMNPCRAVGSGSAGAITDADVTSFRFALIESDKLSIPMQLALFSRLPLPICAIFSSGGKSVHAWVKIEAPDLETYKAIVSRILTVLAPFGCDQSNKNASRLSRLPGAIRTIGSAGDGVQRLLWLNPAAKPLDDAGLDAFEESMKFPAIAEKPFRAVFTSSMQRYEELRASRGATGIMTGLESFDRDTGGLKKGQMIVISAETNGGKTSVAINFVNAAIHAGHSVVLFTMEMDKGEICDILAAMNCRVNRNHFNNGEFTDEEIESMANKACFFNNIPLYVEDESVVNASAIRTRTLQLVREKNVGLCVVDYIQFMTPDNADSHSLREQQLAATSRALRSLAKEARIPIVVLSQLNDDGKLRDSRVIGHDAHIVALVKDIDDSPAFKVVKGRSIPKNTHEFIFEPKYCLMRNPQKIQPRDIPSYDT